jgi:hypothetical protein
MVMFKAKFQPRADKPRASGGNRQQQQQPQPVDTPPREAPPIEKERGPQYPVKEPGPGNPPERAR